MVKYVTRFLALLVAGAAIWATYVASTKEPAQKQAGGQGRRGAANLNIPVPVTGAVARIADVPVFLDGVGTARPVNSVTVKPQVDGRIVKIHFREGQTVQKGDLLVEIDPTTYKAQLDQAVAKRELTQTQLANAKKDADRFAKIPGVIAQKTVDTQAAQVAQFEAQIRADEAAIASVRAVLDYTRITAPLTGRVGLRLVDEGNVVRSGLETGLVTIIQVQPISVQFTLPQQQLGSVNRALGQGRVAAEAIDGDGKTVLDGGELLVVDNTVDQTTGTVRMKADFPNARLQLWPGQFVNVRLKIDTLRQVVVVPTPAVQRGPNGPFVYVASSEGTVSVKPITLTLQTDTDSIIASGVATGESVVTSGFNRLREGARVVISEPPAVGGRQPAPGAGGPQAAAGGGGGGGGGFERIRQACGADIMTHCPGLARDQIRGCMETNVKKFSAPCQTAIAERDSNRPADGQPRGEGKGKRGAPSAEAPAPATKGVQQ